MPNKYGAKRTTVDGVTFHSKREASRYLDLKRLLQSHYITELELQPSYPIVINGIRICTVKLDFRYKENGKTIIEDVKGNYRSDMSKLKRKMVEAAYNIKVILT